MNEIMLLSHCMHLIYKLYTWQKITNVEFIKKAPGEREKPFRLLLH